MADSPSDGQRFAGIVQPGLRGDRGEFCRCRAAVRGEPGKKGVGAERAGDALDDRSDILSTG
jgi:hypothetical protein